MTISIRRQPIILPPGDSERAGEVRVRGLVKRFGALTAVDGVDLDVEPGEFLALLGPSGSGKTTILMSIAGFDFPDAGSITIGGRDVTWAPPNRRDLGMVFQRYTLFPHMSVLENVAFPLKMRRVNRTEREARARAALDTVRLGALGDRKPSQLSGGQQQRVALARAIVYHPQVLLMDEPLSALDKNLREEMQIEIKHLQRELGVTVVFVTHDQTEALTMADRVTVLHGGRLQQIGTPRALYEAPETAFVAGFIGDTNFWPGSTQGDAPAGAQVAVSLDGAGTVLATAATALRAGSAVRLAVRPERVRFAAPGMPGPEGSVQETIYAGTLTTVLLQTAGPLIRVCLPAGSGIDAPEPGSRIALSWQPGDARVFPVDAA
jgi:putative spermidine/putrescine transport system ATP-binding protein/mannopine transport system ATP-binding protein